MKIFISDLHLGDKTRTDDFSRDKEFLEFLDFVDSDAAELIIVGDFMDLWQADLDKVLFAHSKVIERLLKMNEKVTYVIGNHDFIPFIQYTKLNLGVCERYQDKKIDLLAEHGHQYDIFNRYKNPLKVVKWPPGMYLTLVVACLEKLIHPNVDQWAKKAVMHFDEFTQKIIAIKNKVTPATKEYLRRGGHFGEFSQAVKNHVSKGVKIIVFGHTHHAQLEQIDSGIYANCGTWVDGSTPTYISCAEDKIKLIEALTHNVIKELALNKKEK